MVGVEIIYKYFLQLSEKQREQFALLGGLYADWNEKINVVSRKDVEDLYTRHVLHSLGIAKIISFKKGTSVIDVGTGGGFPGIPLAILFPDCSFHLVDSIGKKIKVVNEVVDGLRLTNVKTSHSRVEDVDGKYDFVISRAVASLETYLRWVKGKCRSESDNQLENGILYLKGGDLQAEIEEAQVEVTSWNLSSFFREEFFETKKVIHVPATKFN